MDKNAADPLNEQITKETRVFAYTCKYSSEQLISFYAKGGIPIDYPELYSLLYYSPWKFYTALASHTIAWICKQIVYMDMSLWAHH